MLGIFAEKFAEAGFVALVFDYRYLGGSSGEPRGQVLPHQQQEDYRNAITWLSLQPEVDPDRIGIWGTSYSGGHVLHVAAFDRRVKAVVAQVPMPNGLENIRRLFRPDQFALAKKLFEQDRIRRYEKNEVTYLPPVAGVGQLAQVVETLATADGSSAPETEGGKPEGSEYERAPLTLESIERWFEYTSPEANIHLISPTPLLMIVAESDTVAPTDLAISAYERAREPKSLLLVEAGHYDAYGDVGSKFSVPATEWFGRHLGQDVEQRSKPTSAKEK